MEGGQGNTTDTYRRNLFFVLFLTSMQSTNTQSGQYDRYCCVRWKWAREIPQIHTEGTCFLLCFLFCFVFNSHAVNQYTERTARPVRLYQTEGGQGNATDTERSNLLFVVSFYSHAVSQYTERTAWPVRLYLMEGGQGNTTDTYRRNLFFVLPAN